MKNKIQPGEIWAFKFTSTTIGWSEIVLILDVPQDDSSTLRVKGLSLVSGHYHDNFCYSRDAYIESMKESFWVLLN